MPWIRRRLLWVGVPVAVVAAVAWWLAPGRPRPPRPATGPWLTLGGLGYRLTSDPETFDQLMDKLGGGRTSVGLVSSAQKALLKRLFRAADWDALDALPRVTLAELELGLAALAAQRGTKPPAAPPPPATEDLGLPTGRPAPGGEPFLRDLGLGIRYGDRIDPRKALRYHDSERLAALLDRLALNVPGEPHQVTLDGGSAATPEALVASLRQGGHEVELVDERFAANFGDLEKDGLPVATPLWVATGHILASGDELFLPVPHAQVTLRVRGPRANADVTLYNSLDLTGTGGGGTRFRADLTADQAWVGGRVAHRFRDADAIEGVRIMGLLRRAAHEKVRDRSLALDGYFALGVCTTAPALVEQRLTGKTTLWPLTHDPALFSGDSEIERLVRTLPVDGRGTIDASNLVGRLAGSIPWKRVADIPFPAIAQALPELGWKPEP